jgi:hypothetical protein
MVAMSALPPLLSSDGHLEVRPERWSSRMPASLRERAPRTIKLPDGGDAIFIEGQPPYPVPFLDLRAGRTNETWQPFGVTVDDTAGVGPPSSGLREQDADGLLAEVLFPNMQVGPRLWRNMADDDAYRAAVRAYNDWLGEEYCPVSRDRLIGLGVIPWTNLKDALAELEHCARLGLKGVNLGVFPQRQVVSHARGRHLLGRRDRGADAADRARGLRSSGAARLAADVRVSPTRIPRRSRSSARASSWSGWPCRSSASRPR